MTSPASRLDQVASDLVADTSVVINLAATGVASKILSVLPMNLYIVEQALSELKTRKSSLHPHPRSILEWIDAGQLIVCSLGKEGNLYKESLSSGSSIHTIDDGESATLAYAIEREIVPLTDDRKAHRIARERFPDLPVGTTLDVLTQHDVYTSLGFDGVRDAVFNALKNARIRVERDALPWVVKLMGPDRVLECTSLPERTRRID